MPMPQQPVNPQYMPAQRSMPQPSDAVLRRSRKPTDKNIPDGVEDVVIGDGVQQYKDLRDLEKRLDAAIVRKRLDIQDSISKTVKKYRTMRIWISNTVENQPWQNEAGQDGSTTPGSGRYKVKIEGRLLDDDEEEEDPGSEDDEDKEERDNTKKEDGGKMVLSSLSSVILLLLLLLLLLLVLLYAPMHPTGSSCAYSIRRTPLN